MNAFFPRPHAGRPAAAVPAVCVSLLAAWLPLCAAADPVAAPSASSSLDDAVELNGHSLADRTHWQSSAREASSGGARVTVTRSAAEPLATANQAAGAAGWYGRSGQATQTMMWGRPWSRSALRVGLGVEQRGMMPSGGLYATPYQNLRPGVAGDAGVLVGLALPTGPRSHAFVQTSLVDAPHAQIDDLNLPGAANRDGRQVRVGLVFNSRKPYADLRKGFRMELSGQSSLTFRPGGGKIGMSFQKTW
ncbi:hypothetical protein [Roseateles chitosanitabidus]|uniref:hypothetical protein n=1 Tax=Roseateles chitosanitabidus TaxID=65048 RepID=UPI000829AC61|nr:hypothetical protein [Roseateles chitosanitabidus]